MANPSPALIRTAPGVAGGGRIGWLAASAMAQVLLAVYFQAINWLPMGSWNYQPGSKPLASQAVQGQLAALDVVYVALFLLPVAVYLIAASRRWNWLMWISLVGYTVWLVLQVVSWWIPYVLGASDSWMATYHRVFSQSTQLLPSFGRHLAPDGLHIVLSLLLAAVVVTTTTGLVKFTTQGRREARQ
jgi:hypothetical protein